MTDVKKELLTGAVWTSAAKYSNILVQLGVTAVLSRLLLPEDFGVVAVTTVIVSFFAIFSDLESPRPSCRKRSSRTTT